MWYLFDPTPSDQSSSSTHSQQSFSINNKYNPQPSLNQNFMQPPMTSLEDIHDPNKAMNTTLILFAKAFQLSAPTNNNQRTSSNPRNHQLAHSIMNMGQDRQIQNVGGNDENQIQGAQNTGQNAGVQNGRDQNGLASTSGTQHDKAPVYDTDGSAEVQLNDNCYDNEIFYMFTQEEQYTDLLEPILEPQLVPQNDNHVTYVAPSMVHSEGIDKFKMLEEMTRISLDSMLVKWHSISKGIMHDRIVGFKSGIGKSFHEQIEEELTETDIKRMDADDQAIQTILLGLPKDVYAAVDSCETAKEIWERVRQMMKGSDIVEQEKKAKLFNEWKSSRLLTGNPRHLCYWFGKPSFDAYKDNYVSWSSRIIKYARSRPNGKIIVDSIENEPYVRRMIATPGEPDLPVLVPKSFHEQIEEELTETDIKRMDADDQAIQTILLGLPKDVYAAVDSCETAKEIWERVRQMMKGSDIVEQEKKAKLFNEWKSSRLLTGNRS
nr:integrase, catalytic region, zinc finger, CCHC-type, peptidase aspartic, catalytic [Tanacetum cinerariifolium]